jgi:hypothetical protein
VWFNFYARLRRLLCSERTHTRCFLFTWFWGSWVFLSLPSVTSFPSHCSAKAAFLPSTHSNKQTQTFLRHNPTMDATSTSKYPKTTPVAVQPGVTDPYTIQFVRNFESQLDRIQKANPNDLAEGIPGLNALSFQYDKVFRVDGIKLSYPIVLSVGFGNGFLLACPDGITIRETKRPEHPSHFWTASDLALNPLASFGDIPEPFRSSPTLRAGLLTPMSPEVQALVRYFTVLRAKDTDLTKHRLEFPDFEDLKRAIRLLTPNAAEHDESTRVDRNEPNDTEIDNDATEILSLEDDEIGPVVSPIHRSTQISPLGPPICPIVPHNDLESPDPDEKRQKDLNKILLDKRHIKRQVEKQCRLADYKIYEATKLLKMGERWLKDAYDCLKEAGKARLLAKEEQMEIDAIDALLVKALGGDSPTEHTNLQRSRVTHLTRYGVKDLGEKE